MSTTRVVAQSPFDDVTASIVLRCCDNVDFYVYQEILKAASPFFRTMFSLPQPSSLSINTSTSNDELSPEGLPIISIPEDSETFDYILRLCYPIRAPARLTSHSLAETVLTAALKYDIDKVIELAKENLVELGRSSPVRLYMFSCEHGLEHEARIAADVLRTIHTTTTSEKEFVRIAMEIYDEGYRGLPAIFLYHLLQHIRTGDQQTFCSSSQPNCAGLSAPDVGNTNDDSEGNELPLDLAEMFIKYPADIFLQSSDGVIIAAHRVILRVSSGDTILSQSEADDCPKHDGHPLVSVALTGKEVIQLVRACYFLSNCDEDNHKPEDDLRLAYAANKYDMSKIAGAARKRWRSHLQTDPFNAYFIACLNEWQDEAYAALRHMAKEGMTPSTAWASTMANPGTAKYYFNFLKYFSELHNLGSTVPDPFNFALRGQETWNSPFYACSSSIAPAIAYRALNELYTSQLVHTRNYYNNQPVNIVDPPFSDAYSQPGLRFPSNPAQYIRAMVQDSQSLDESRKKSIEQVCHISSSPFTTRLIPLLIIQLDIADIFRATTTSDTNSNS